MKIATKKQRALEIIGLGFCMLAQAQLEEESLVRKMNEQKAKRDRKQEKRFEKEFRRKKTVQAKRRNRR